MLAWSEFLNIFNNYLKHEGGGRGFDSGGFNIVEGDQRKENMWPMVGFGIIRRSEHELKKF